VTDLSIGDYLPIDTTSHPRRLKSSSTPLWETKISQLQQSSKGVNSEFG